MIEKYDATVTKVDQKQPGYIMVKCVGLLGDEDTELPMWVRPAFDWGWFYIPEIGEIVEVEVLTGSPQDEIVDQMAINNLDIQWRGKRHYTNATMDPKSGSTAATVHPDFTSENYGKRRGFATPAGHVIVFDDTAGKTKIWITWSKMKDDKVNVTQMVFDTDGTFKVNVLGKHSIHLKEDEVEIKLSDGAAAKITGKDANAATVLGDGGVKAAIADHLKTLWNNNKSIHSDVHKHPTAFGLSGPADVPAEAWNTAIESTKLKFPDG